ncbi:MAG: shikimate kinase [Rhodospirillales bacterium]|jgi:shikimate kinase|nr:shikimate kinase [Rhodospirillales bacterium]
MNGSTTKDDSVSRRSLVLVGLMGAGKSKVGRLLAERLGLPFVDADAEIEEAAGCSVADYFARFGEAAFRAGERKVMARLLAGPPQVIAAGGGAFMDEGTRDEIRAHGTSIWLKASLETLVARTKGRNHRPLLNQGDPAEILARLMEARYPVYAQADVTVESGNNPPEATCEAVLTALGISIHPKGRAA